MALLTWLRMDCPGEPKDVLQAVEDVAVGNFALNEDVAARRQPWRVVCTSYKVPVHRHMAGLRLGELPPPPAPSLQRQTLFMVRARGEAYVVFDGAVVDGDARIAAFLARHGVENKHGEQDGAGGARRKNRDQYDNKQTKKDAQRTPSAELDFVGWTQGFQYDCGDYLLRAGVVFIKGNNSHNLVLEVEYLPPGGSGAGRAHQVAAAEDGIVREVAEAAFNIGTGAARSSGGHRDGATEGGGEAPRDVELRRGPPVDGVENNTRIKAVVGYVEAIDLSTRTAEQHQAAVVKRSRREGVQ